MKDLNISKGEWKTNFPINSNATIRTKLITIATMHSVTKDAYLIADAGNTAQKCGMLPSELLEKVDELNSWKKEAIEKIEQRDELLRCMKNAQGILQAIFKKQSDNWLGSIKGKEFQSAIDKVEDIAPLG